MSIGGNSSKQKSSSTQQSQNQSASQSFVDPSQSPFLRGLYGLSSGFTNPFAQQTAAAQAGAFANPALQGAVSNLGAMTNPQAQIDAQTSSLQSGLGRLFREEINPQLTSDAILAGGLGGGRQGVAQGVAAGQLASAYTEGVGDIVARANQNATAAAGILPGVTQGLLQSRLAPQTAGLDVLAQLSGILGSPTILQRTQASGSSGSAVSSSGKSAGFNLGLGGLF